jgi:hypothetical protein
MSRRFERSDADSVEDNDGRQRRATTTGDNDGRQRWPMRTTRATMKTTGASQRDHYEILDLSEVAEDERAYRTSWRWIRRNLRRTALAFG